MFVKDYFLHSIYLKTGKKQSIRKTTIVSYEEIEGGTQIISSEAELPVLITMPHEDVVKEMQENVA